MTTVKRRKAARRRRGQPRNPFAVLARRRGQGIQASAKTYRRRPKHRKPSSDDGGFSLGGAFRLGPVARSGILPRLSAILPALVKAHEKGRDGLASFRI